MITIKRASSGGGVTTKNNFAATVNPAVTDDSSAGYATGSSWLRTDTGDMWRCRSASAGAAVWTKIDVADFDVFQVANWYNAFGTPPCAAGTAFAANSLRLFPGIIKERVTLNALGCRIQTGAAGNVQLGIYKNLGGRPTGNVLDKTASLSTASIASVNGAPSGSTLQLEPGLYWFAAMTDNGSCVIIGLNGTSAAFPQVIGATTQASVSATSSVTGYSTPCTFGTWPDVTSATLTEVMGGAMPSVHFKVASVP